MQWLLKVISCKYTDSKVALEWLMFDFEEHSSKANSQ